MSDVPAVDDCQGEAVTPEVKRTPFYVGEAEPSHSFVAINDHHVYIVRDGMEAMTIAQSNSATMSSLLDATYGNCRAGPIRWQ